jgi:hypothetical protein
VHVTNINVSIPGLKGWSRLTEFFPMASFVGYRSALLRPAICFSTLHVGVSDVVATFDDACPTSSAFRTNNIFVVLVRPYKN